MVPANSCCHEEGGDHLPLFWTITATNKTAKIRHFMVLFLLLLSLVISWLISSNNFFVITHTHNTSNFRQKSLPVTTMLVTKKKTLRKVLMGSDVPIGGERVNPL